MKNLWRNVKFYFYEIDFEFGGGYKIFVKDAMKINKKHYGNYLVLKEEYLEWLRENTKGRFCIHRIPILDNWNAYITFAQKSEAMHFKLVWIGE